MKIIIESEVEFKPDFDVETLFLDIDKQILLALNVPDILRGTEVNVTLTDNEVIREMNNEFRGIDSATDVLSFPMMEFEAPLIMDSGNIMDEDDILGDIVISVDRCSKQAEEYGHSLKRELAFLFTHGMLHILGYDHINDDERMEMEEAQRNILDGLGIKR